jgi:NCS1 family nucleobase:cation symporter-1
VVVLAHVTSADPPPGLSEPLLADAGTRWMVALMSLFGVAVATIATNIAANVVSPANDFAHCAPRLISFKVGGVITGVIGILIMPWKLLASADTYIFNWLVGYGSLLGPIAGIMVTDYWLVRRRELDVADLYRPSGRYAGVNWVAMAALCAGVAPNVVGFLRSVKLVGGGPDLWDHLYPYSWFIGFGVASAAYALGMRRSAFGRAGR